MSNLKAFFEEVSSLVNTELDWLIPAVGPGPRSLRDAMRWSLFGGGKHFRPALVFAVGRTMGASDKNLVRTAAAVEMIHTYSLIHDDLPSMDDDDLRRGRATCHLKYGEATAILAGDALQVLAFQAIAEDEGLSIETRLKLIRGLALASTKMVVGQQLDLEAEGRELSITEIENIHANKTGALITFSANAGAIIAGAAPEAADIISQYAEGVGLLFQITDDLLDVTASTEQIGKTAGKDEAAQKATYPRLLGIEQTKIRIDEVSKQTASLLDSLPGDSALLRSIPDFIVSRMA